MAVDPDSPLPTAPGASSAAARPGEPRGLGRADRPRASEGFERGRRARFEALVGLLGDSPADPQVLLALRAAGAAAVPALRRGARDGDARRRVQARALLLDQARLPARRRLLKALARGNYGLLQGMLLLSRSEQPDLDARPLLAEIERLAQRVQERAGASGGDFAGPLALIEVLCKESGLSGGSADPGSLAELFLERVLIGRRGLPLPLVVLHLLVAERAGLAAAAVPLPGRVLLRLYSGQRTLLADPFAGGKLRTRRECLSYLESRGLAARPEWFQDAEPALLVHRHLLNLERAYRRLGRPQDAQFARLAASVAGIGRDPAPAAGREGA
jgi:regulator of sirC expression with transglutaminase-like and TPR domain